MNLWPLGRHILADRLDIRLDDHDLIAGAQILAWIARPHRPESGVELLNHWFLARRRHRGDPLPALPFELKKPNRIEYQLAKFRTDLMRGFRAGLWFEQRSMSGPNRPALLRNFDVKIRSLARRQLPIARRDPENEGNIVRDIWSRRKPIAHLAIAAGSTIARLHQEREVVGFDLEMTVFDPIWVSEAISESESRAGGSFLTGALQPEQLYRFHRDSF